MFLCFVLFFFLNNFIFLVKVRLLCVCLVIENLDEKGKKLKEKTCKETNTIIVR